jgi:carotenoid cleavage dioxygenase-like enzyme
VWDLPGGARWRHWFDGLALLHRVRFEAGGVRYRNRFLDTEDARLSRARGRPELGGYGTRVVGGLGSRLWHLFNPRRIDNGCVVLSRCDGEWIAMTESDRVTRFDPDTLATLGEWRWADTLKLPLMAAHPGIDARGQWWNVGICFGRSCEYVLVGADRRGQREVKARIPTFRPGYLHALAPTEHHAVIWECAWRAHPLRFLFAVESYAEHFDWMPGRGSRLHAVSLADGSVRSWDTKPLFVPRPGASAEDDGVLLVNSLSDGDAGSVIRVLDAATLDERAAIELPAVVPFGFHGAWHAKD